MELEIIKKTENDFLSRTEAKFTIKHEGTPTPSLEEAKKLLAAKLGADIELIIIRKISSDFGLGASTGLAHIYTSKEALEKSEPKHFITRNTARKKKEAAEKPAEATPATAAAPTGEATKEGESVKEGEASAEQPAKEKSAEEKKEAPTAEEKKEASAESKEKAEEKKEELKEEKAEEKTE